MKKLTDITIVLDRSGSMESIKEVTIAGFNKFIKARKKSKRETYVSLIQFDDEYEKLYEYKPIKKVPLLNAKTFIPRGTTALLDAIGKTITHTLERNVKTGNKNIKKDVFFVIITDGLENASKEYNVKQIIHKISTCEKKMDLQFIYLGANQDAIEVAETYGISYKRSMTFAANKQGVKNMFSDLCENIATYETNAAKGFEFTEKQRNKQTK